MKVFIKTLVADELPDFNKTVCTDKGNARYFKSLASWQTFEGYVKPNWWLKEVEIPDEQLSDEFVIKEWGFYNKNVTAGIKIGIQHVISKLK